MAAVIPFVRSWWPDINGKPLAGGKLWTYQAGTNTPIASYTDSTGTVPNTNPVILDSSGRAQVYLAPGSYKIVLMDKNDVVQWTEDKVKPADGGGGGIVDSDYVFDLFSPTLLRQLTTTGLMDTLTNIISLGWTQETDSTTTGSNQTATIGALMHIFTNASLTSIAGLTAPTETRFGVIVNRTGADITIVNNAMATAADRIITGTGGIISLKNDGAVWLIYDSAASRWQVIGANSGGAIKVGTKAAPTSITAVGGITHNQGASKEIQYLQGSGGPVVVSANPQISSGFDGEEIRIFCCSNTNTLELNDGNGLTLNGKFIGVQNSILDLHFDGTSWVEIGRNSL